MVDSKYNVDAEALSVPQRPAREVNQQVVDLPELPNGYYRSKNFIGSLIATCLMAISLYLGYVLPVSPSRLPSIGI